MHGPLLWIASAVVPVVWGWIVFRVVKRFWPADPKAIERSVDRADGAKVSDFQI